jgi:hypothetical protein
VKLKKIQYSKRSFKKIIRIKIDMKNKHNAMIKGWNWKEYYFLQQNKKIKIKLKNIIASIWIEEWNW